MTCLKPSDLCVTAMKIANLPSNSSSMMSTFGSTLTRTPLANPLEFLICESVNGLLLTNIGDKKMGLVVWFPVGRPPRPHS